MPSPGYTVSASECSARAGSAGASLKWRLQFLTGMFEIKTRYQTIIAYGVKLKIVDRIGSVLMIRLE